MDLHDLIHTILLFLRETIPLYRKYFKRYHIEDLNGSEKEEAARYFTKKGWKYIEDLLMKYDKFIDKEFIQNSVFSNLRVDRKSQGLVLDLLNNQNEWRIRYGALILAKSATMGYNVESKIIDKVKEISRHDHSKECRIAAYDVLVGKLSGGSLEYLLWGIENDSQKEVIVYCVDRLEVLRNRDQMTLETLQRTFERREKIGDTEVIGKIFEMAGEMKIREFHDHLIRHLDHENKILSLEAALALLKICEDRALDPIKERCLTARDQSYRKRIIEDGFIHKGESRRAIEILRSHSKEHPDDERIVIQVLARLFNEEGGKSWN